MSRRGSSRHHLLSLEITPMVDVVFLLIIFFMVTARFARESRAELDLPVERGQQEQLEEAAGVIINLAADGSMMINGEPRDLEYLQRVVLEEIAAAPGGDPANVVLTLRADRMADTADLNRVIETLRGMGVVGARMATEVPSGS